MGDGKPYVALGEVMDEFARRAPHNVRGPHRIANYVRTHAGEYPSGVAVSKWMYGASNPNPEYLETFAEVFGLSEREKVRLAYAYAFRFPSAA